MYKEGAKLCESDHKYVDDQHQVEVLIIRFERRVIEGVVMY